MRYFSFHFLIAFLVQIFTLQSTSAQTIQPLYSQDTQTPAKLKRTIYERGNPRMPDNLGILKF